MLRKRPEVTYADSNDLVFETPGNSEDFYNMFTVSPLERGYGVTLGNSLRRILLSSLPGAAIINCEIDGVQHEFSSIEGVVEDVTSIVLNLKEVVLSIDNNDPNVEKRLEISVKGPHVVTAKDIKCDNEVTIVNEDQHIATVNKGEFHMVMVARKGIGYVNFLNFCKSEEINTKWKLLELIIQIETEKKITQENILALINLRNENVLLFSYFIFEIIVKEKQFLRETEKRYPLDPEGRMTWGLMKLLQENGFREKGHELETKIYSADFGMASPTKAKIKFFGQKTIKIAGEDVNSYKSEITLFTKMGKMKTINWLDEDGFAIRTKMQMGGIPIEIKKSTKLEAQSRSDQTNFDFLFQTLLFLDCNIDTFLFSCTY